MEIHWRLGFVLLAMTTVLASCATAPSVQQADTPAERIYRLGEVHFGRGDFTGAIEKYNKVRNNHPYSRYAVQADLRIADAYFEQKQWTTAAEQYRTFVKLHPNHKKAVYAKFRVGKALHNKMPKNWFFLPPAYERDLASTRNASRALKSFVKQYPDTKYTKKARKILRKTRRRLADHEMYVANFYLERKNPRGAMMRLKYLLDNYSGLGLDPKALYLLAVSYLKLGDTKKAKTALQDLIQYHADSNFAQKAEAYMASHDLSG